MRLPPQHAQVVRRGAALAGRDLLGTCRRGAAGKPGHATVDDRLAGREAGCQPARHGTARQTGQDATHPPPPSVPVRRSIVEHRCMMSSKRPGVPISTWPPFSLKEPTSTAGSLRWAGKETRMCGWVGGWVGWVGWVGGGGQGTRSWETRRRRRAGGCGTRARPAPARPHQHVPAPPHLPPTRSSARSQATVAMKGCATSKIWRASSRVGLTMTAPTCAGEGQCMRRGSRVLARRCCGSRNSTHAIKRGPQQAAACASLPG